MPVGGRVTGGIVSHLTLHCTLPCDPIMENSGPCAGKIALIVTMVAYGAGQPGVIIVKMEQEKFNFVLCLEESRANASDQAAGVGLCIDI